MKSIPQFQTRALHPNLGAEVLGVDFTKPMAEEAIEEIRKLADDFGILLFRNSVVVSDEDQLSFCRQLGPGDILGFKGTTVTGSRLAAGVTAVGNIGDDNEILPLDSRRRAFMRGNELWHTDSSFSADRGAYSVLKAVEIPPEGVAPTQFADMHSAHQELPVETRASLDSLFAEHSLTHSRAMAGYVPDESERLRFPPMRQPLIIMNTRTGRKSLHLASHISSIEGLSDLESASLLDSLLAFATQERFVYQHTWSIGDMVLWDNLATMHRATSFLDNRLRREMHRVTTLQMAGTY